MPSKKPKTKKSKEKKDKKGAPSKLEEKLLSKKESVWTKADKKQTDAIFDFSNGYKVFLDAGKTEREAALEIVRLAKARGFLPLEAVKRIKPGDKFYISSRGKNVALVVIGKKPLEFGLSIIVSHIDSPRLDLKQHSLYEDKDAKLGMLKTHYYGGIKKYQWVSIPLALHGRVIKKDGKAVDIKVGEAPGENVFTIPDLLPHLAYNAQAGRKLSEGIKGEELNAVAGSIPLKKEKGECKIKLGILSALNKKYGIIEEDFVSAELELVPAFSALDVGFDKSLVGAYGQDDRICAYTSMTALFDAKQSNAAPGRTRIALFYDKEEIGSDGATGAKAKFLESVVGRLLSLANPNYRDSSLRQALENSKALSADVTGGMDPMFKEVHELSNAAFLGFGVVISKFTGSGGKYSTSDASAEYVGEIRSMLNNAKVKWQSAELGKVDEGGGGTIAKFLAEHNMDIIDCGPALIGMHSPFELSSKADVYSTYQAYKAFFEDNKSTSAKNSGAKYITSSLTTHEGEE